MEEFTHPYPSVTIYRDIKCCDIKNEDVPLGAERGVRNRDQFARRQEIQVIRIGDSAIWHVCLKMPENDSSMIKIVAD